MIILFLLLLPSILIGGCSTESPYQCQINDTHVFTKLTQADFAAGTTVTLSSPGLYIVEENCTFAPATTNTPAISITASNVVLDFNYRSLTQTNSTTGVNAVSIASGVTNIVIKNGKIDSFRNAAILSNTNASCIKITNMTIVNFAIGITMSSVTKITFNRCIFYTPAANGNVVSLTNCSIIVAKNSHVYGTSTGVSSSDFIFDSCNLFVVDNCSIKNTTVTGSISFAFFSCKNGIISRCINAQNTFNSTSSFFVSGCTQIALYYCICSNNTALSSNYNGFVVSGNSRGISLKNCIASRNTSPVTTTAFSCANNTCTLDCFALSNNLGIGFQGQNHDMFINAAAYNNVSSATGFRGIGFNFASTGIQGSYAHGCRSFDQTTGYTGFNGLNNSILTECIASQNATNYYSIPAGALQTASLNTMTSVTVPWTNADLS